MTMADWREATSLAYVRALMDWKRTGDPAYLDVVTAMRRIYIEEVDAASDALKVLAEPEDSRRGACG